jgi:hypothetical protein
MSTSLTNFRVFFALIIAIVADFSPTAKAAEPEPPLPAIKFIPKLSNSDLGVSFLAAGEMLSTGIGVIHEALTQLKKEGQLKDFPNVSGVSHNPDGSSQTHTFTDYDELDRYVHKIRRFHSESKAQIFKRGFNKVEGSYEGTVSSGCSKDWLASGPVNSQRTEFYFVLLQDQKGFEGVAVRNAVVVIFPGGFQAPLVGKMKDSEIALKATAGDCRMTLKPRK